MAKALAKTVASPLARAQVDGQEAHDVVELARVPVAHSLSLGPSLGFLELLQTSLRQGFRRLSLGFPDLKPPSRCACSTGRTQVEGRVLH